MLARLQLGEFIDEQPAAGGSEYRIRRMCELAEKAGNVNQLVHGLFFLSQFCFVCGYVNQGLEVSTRCLKLAEGTGEDWLVAEAHSRHGILAYSAGRFREAVSHLNQAETYIGRTDREISPIGFLYSTTIIPPRCVALQMLGRADEPLRLIQEELRQTRASKHMFSLSLMLSVWLATLYRLRRDAPAALTCADEAIALAEENGFKDFLNWGHFDHGWAVAELGDPERGIAEMEGALNALLAYGGSPWRYHSLALIGQNYARVGRIDAALETLNRALVDSRRSGESADEAETLRLKGEALLLRSVSAGEAESCFREAIQLARRQEAKWWELRATTSLARLLASQGKRDEARTMLAEIYNWFTEGFDTADLKDAKALLQELSG
jgi:tetratricopeptide (TPR) repeat protein